MVKFKYILLMILTVETVNAQNVRFINTTISSGTGTSKGIYGATISDWNGDGHPDIYVSTKTGNDYLFTANGDMTFIETFLENGFIHSGIAAGSIFADLDNDGDEDAFIGMRGGSNFIYENNNNAFTQLNSDIARADSAKAAAVLTVDYDNDGLLDIYVANWNAPNK